MRVAHHHATQAQRSRPPEREREKTIEPRATSPRIGFAKKSCDRRFARRAWCTGVASITSLFELVPRPASFVRSFRRLGPRIGAPPGRTTGSSEKKKRYPANLLCIMSGDQESRTRKSAVHLSGKKGRYVRCVVFAGRTAPLHRVPFKFHLRCVLYCKPEPEERGTVGETRGACP